MKYSRMEIERRWLVELAAVGDLGAVPYREIEGLYVADSRLRLRRMTDPKGERIFKFGKKYGKSTPTSEPVTNLYLTASEYKSLSSLPGISTLKRRYSLQGGALDVYLRPSAGLPVFEVEFDDESSARAYVPPPFVTREITADSSFSGISLAEARDYP